jgi:small-conductance mechanosensitive channel
METTPPVRQPLQQPPVQPPLIASLGGGILTYCGLIVAAIAALMNTVKFTNAAECIKIIATIDATASLLGGIFALLGMTSAVNLARRAEKNEMEKIDTARYLSALFTNISLITMIVCSALTIFTLIGVLA